MILRSISQILKLILVIYSLAFFNSCGPIHEWPTAPSKPSLGKGTKVRFVNTSLNTSPIDFVVDGNKLYSYSTYNLATGYYDINPGIHEFRIIKNSDSELILKDTLKLDTNKIYILHFTGKPNDYTIKLYDRTDFSVQGNLAYARFINSSKDLSNVDLKVYNQTDNFLFSDIGYNSGTGFIKLTPGPAKIDIFRAQTENLIFSSKANFEGGKIYSVFLSGNLAAFDSTALNAYFLDETKNEEQTLFNFEVGTTKIRFVNGISTAQSIQVLVDDVLLRNSLGFNQSTAFLTFKSGARKLRINVGVSAGYLDTVIVFDELRTYTVYFSNTENNFVAVKLLNESQSIAGNRSLVRFVNSTIDLQNLLVNLKSISGQTIVDIPNYFSSSNYIEVPTGQNLITLSSSGKPNLVSIAAFLEGGRVYTAFVSGSYLSTSKTPLRISFIKDNDSLAQNLFTFEQVKSSIRLINGSPELLSVDLEVDSVKLNSETINYKYASRNFQVNTGFRTIKTKISGEVNPFFEQTLNVEVNKNYLLLAVDKLQTPDILVLESGQRAVPFGKSSIRFVNGIYDLNSVDINIINSSGTINLTQNIFKNITSYVDLPSGKNQFIITSTQNQQLLLTCEAQFEVGYTYTALLSGISTGSSDKKYSISFLKESNDTYHKLTEFEPIKTNLRFINAITDNPVVDLYADQNQVAIGVSYKLATSLNKVPSGQNVNLKVTHTGTNTQLYNKVVNIDYSKNYSFIVCGEINFPDGFLIENPVKTAPPGKSSVRFIHGASGLGSMAVSITNSTGTVSIPSIQFKNASNYFDLISGRNQITVTISTVSGNIILTSDANLEENKVYSIYVIGNPSGSMEQALDIYFLDETNSGAQSLFKFSAIKSKLRFVNGSTDNPLLELNVDNEFVATNVSYKLATSILNVNSGVNKSVKVFEFGSTTPLLSANLTLSHAKNYSLLVTNKKTNLEYIFFENPAKTVAPGKAAVRVVHGAYDLSAVDITFNNYTSKTKISNLNYKGISSYIDLSAGFNEIIITKTSSPNTLILAIDATLEEGKLYTIYFLGNSSGNFGEEYSLNFLDENNPGGQFLFTYTPSTIARLRFINASPNSPGLDVSLDNSKFAQNVLFGNSSGYLFMRSGLREVNVTPGGQNSPVLINFNYLFETNKLYSLLVMDSVSNITPVLIEDMNFTLEEGKAYVRFINASSNSPPFDIKIGNPSGVIKHSYFTYQQITSYEPYDPQILSFVFTRTNSLEELVSLRGFSLIAGKAYTIVVMGFYQGQTGQHLQIKWFQDN